MLNASLKTKRSLVARRLRRIQQSWSPNERRQRAIQARHRVQELLSLIGLLNPVQEMWAVGAPVLADVNRIIR